jgi:MFS family permease
MDRVGRKPLMLAGVAGCCICLIIEAAMVASFASPIPATNPNEAGLRVGVAALYMFLAVYSVGIDCAGVVFYGELFPNHIRGKGLSLSIATIALTDLVYLQATATAFANIGWKFYLVFIVISGLGVVWMVFVIPETKGIPLEEIAMLFGDNEEVMVFSRDIRVDHATHELVVGGDKHVATEGMGPQGVDAGGEKGLAGAGENGEVKYVKGKE